MIISIDVENTFDKFQHHIIHNKNSQKNRIKLFKSDKERQTLFLNLIKSIYKNLQLTLYLKVKN